MFSTQRVSAPLIVGNVLATGLTKRHFSFFLAGRASSGWKATEYGRPELDAAVMSRDEELMGCSR